MMDVIFCCLAGASIAYYLFCIVAAQRFVALRKSRTIRRLVADPPPVSLLIPLCGTEFDAYENHASFCRQGLPGLQIVFGVMDPGDAAVPVVQRLMADFPEVDMELVVGTETIGPNPKVNNLHNMLKRAKHDLLVMADSDVRVRPGDLATIVSRLASGEADLVTCLYRAGSAPGIGAKIEALAMSTDFIPSVLVACVKEGLTFALGAIVALSRRDLEAIGGFRAVSESLVEDYLFGLYMKQRGKRIELAPFVVETLLSPMTAGEVWGHQVRLARGKKACRPAGHIGSVIMFGPVLSLFYLFLSGGSALAFTCFFLVSAVRFWMAYAVGVNVLGDSILGRNLWLLPLKDCFSFCAWCASLRNGPVLWRGRHYRLDRGGRMTPID